jgi:predicted dehydrogenase
MPAIASLPDLSISAICDFDSDRLHAVADSFAVEKTYDDYQELLSDGEVDLIAICVPAAMREEILFSAFETGKHVFVEKPLALNLPDGERIMRASASANGQVFVGHNIRCHRLAQECRELLGSGGVGTIELVSSVWSTDLMSARGIPAWRERAATGGGVVYEMAIHHFDLIEWLLSDRFESVWCADRSRSSDTSSAVVAGTTREGALVTSVFSQESVPRNYVEIYGSHGRIELDLYRFDGLRYQRGGAPSGSIQNRLQGLFGAMAQLPKVIQLARKGGDYKLSYQRQWERIGHTLGGSAENPCTLREGLRAVEVALAALESARTRSSVAVARSEGSADGSEFEDGAEG